MSKNKTPVKAQIIHTLIILALGIGLGTFSKYLDYQQSALPFPLSVLDHTLDLHNFLGGFAPFITCAVCIAIYSSTSIRAAVNVFVFFAGFVSSYYLYCYYAAGFFPKDYALIWIAFTAISPVPAFFCWYAKGKGWAAAVLSAGIIGVLFNTAFAYGSLYIFVRSWLNVLMLLIVAAVLYKPKKQFLFVLGAGAVFAVLMNILLPFQIW